MRAYSFSALLFIGAIATAADAWSATSANFGVPATDLNMSGVVSAASPNFTTFADIGSIAGISTTSIMAGRHGAAYTIFALPGQSGKPAATAVGVSSISWNWSAASDAVSYLIYQASSPTTLIGAIAGGAFFQTGLSTNTAYGIILYGINANGNGMLSSAATAYTLAAPPSGLTASQVWATSATVSWSLNTNPSGTIAEVQRSTDNSVFSSVFSGAATAFGDYDLLGCTPYYFRVRNFNGDNIPTAFDISAPFTTKGSTPAVPSNLSAESLTGNQISLSWDPSPSEGITEYRLYCDNGSGTVDYNTPLAVLSSTVTSWTKAGLASGTSYIFALRAKNRCGVEEKNTSLLASAVSLNSLTGVRAAIKVPQTGKQIKGNSLTVAAELLLGDPAQTKQVLFQYRLPGGAWTNIIAANANHPNPDVSSPYFVHWDVDALAVANPTLYELRAVATDTSNTTDSSPPSITITVMPAASIDYDINETLASGKAQKIDNAIANTIQAGDVSSALTAKVVIPSGALAVSTATVTVVNNPALKPPPPQGAEDIGMVTKIDLSSQGQLSSGKTATLTLNYKDDNNDGIVDGTTVRVDRLKMYSASSAAGPWVKDVATILDTANKTVQGMTSHFSFFAVFAAAAADLSTVRVYPIPFVPNDSDTDNGVPYTSGNGNSGIIFDNLPNGVSIRIYTVTGQLVTKFSSDSTGGKLQWDAKNDSGKDVATGLYVAVITSPGSSRLAKKLLIVR